MRELGIVLAYTTLAGAAIPIGGLLARIERLRPNWLEQEFRHGVIAFGGGILVAAVALVLVPEGSKKVSVPVVMVMIAAGSLVFLMVDRWLARQGGSGAMLIAMLLDFVPS